MKSYTVHCIEKNILNGTDSFENKIWDKAIVLTDFCSPWGNLEINKIEFRALWDFDSIHFMFKVYDNQIYIETKDDTIESIGNSDRIEIFFRSNSALNPYYCLEIDPTPRIMDFKAKPKQEFDFDWNWPAKDLIIKSIINKDYFIVEIAISISSLEEFNLIKNNKIEAGLFRAKYSENENLKRVPTWISWINPNTESPNFHVSSSFGILNLVLP